MAAGMGTCVRGRARFDVRGLQHAIERRNLLTAEAAARELEAVTGALTFLGAGGAAALAAGAAIPPIAPFVAAVAAGSFYFKLRAKWVKEDPPRPDYELVAEFQPPRIDVMAVLPPGPVPPGVSILALLHAAGASIEATVLAMERAMGASIAAWAGQPESTVSHGASRSVKPVSMQADLKS